MCSRWEAMGFPLADVRKGFQREHGLLLSWDEDRGGGQTLVRQGRGSLVIRLKIRAGLPFSKGWGLVRVNEAEQKNRY